MAALRLNGDMHLLSTRYRVSSDGACRFKRQKWMVEVLRETSSDIGRIGLTGHERELLNGCLVRVYALEGDRVRLDSTSAKTYAGVSAEGLFQFGHSKDYRPDLPQVKVSLSALDPLGMPLTTT